MSSLICLHSSQHDSDHLICWTRISINVSINVCSTIAEIAKVVRYRSPGRFVFACQFQPTKINRIRSTDYVKVRDVQRLSKRHGWRRTLNCGLREKVTMYLIWSLWLVSLVVWSSQHEISPKGLVCFFVVKAELSLLTYIYKSTPIKWLALCLSRANAHTQQKELLIRAHKSS